MSAAEIVSSVLLALGTLFLLGAALGVVRLPDFYSRLHAAGKADTMGQLLLLLGLGVSAGATLVSVKLALMVFFVFVLNPTATHALARGAWVCGVRPQIGRAEKAPRQREGQVGDAERDALVEPLHGEEGEEEAAWSS